MKNNEWSEAVLRLLFLNEAVEGVGDGAGLIGSSSPGSLYLSAHTSDPELDGDQSSSETSYSGYARVAIARSGSQWTVDLIDPEVGPGRAMNNNSIVFPECSGGSPVVISHIGVGTSANGDGKLLYSGQLLEARSVSAGVALIISPGALVLTED